MHNAQNYFLNFAPFIVLRPCHRHLLSLINKSFYKYLYSIDSLVVSDKWLYASYRLLSCFLLIVVYKLTYAYNTTVCFTDLQNVYVSIVYYRNPGIKEERGMRLNKVYFFKKKKNEETKMSAREALVLLHI